MGNKTMEQFKTLLSEVEELRNKEKQLIENFEQSSGDLSAIFHDIIKTILKGDSCCYFNLEVCPTNSAKELQKMGFDVFPEENCFDILCGYKIRNLHLWKELGE